MYRPSDLERQILCTVQGITASTAPSWTVENAAAGSRLYVHKMIGGWQLDAGRFVETVHGLQTNRIDLHVNSPGGIVFDAVAMYEALRSHPARVVAHVDGLAASAASVLIMAADEIEIAEGGRIMVHDARGGVWGSPDEIRAHADLVESISNDIAGFYASRAGGTRAKWRNAMRATTWYSAAESVAAKLADRIAGKNTGPDDRTRIIQARHRALTTQGG